VTKRSAVVPFFRYQAITWPYHKRGALEHIPMPLTVCLCEMGHPYIFLRVQEESGYPRTSLSVRLICQAGSTVNLRGYPNGQIFQFRSLYLLGVKVKCQIYSGRQSDPSYLLLYISLYLLLPPLPPSPPADTLYYYCLLFPCFLLLYSLLLLLYSLLLCLLSTYYFIFESSREDLLNPF